VSKSGCENILNTLAQVPLGAESSDDCITLYVHAWADINNCHLSSCYRYWNIASWSSFRWLTVAVLISDK